MFTILFDLGGVLLEEAESHVVQRLLHHGVIKTADGKTPRIFNRAFAFAHHVSGKDYKKDWIMGTISSSTIITIVETSIDSGKYDQFFTSLQEKNLIRTGIALILDPVTLTHETHIDTAGFTFVQRCVKNNIRPLIASNWDPTSFALITQKFSPLFSLFSPEDIIIPAEAGFIKPEFGMYDYIIKKAKLNPAQTFFIDDSPVNTHAAQDYGIISITHKNWHDTEQLLKERGLPLMV